MMCVYNLENCMRTMAVAFALLAALTLSACGRDAPPAAPKTATTPPVSSETKAEKKHEVPETHGMPGMSELVKGEEKGTGKENDKK